MTLEPTEKRALSDARMGKAREFLDDGWAAHREGRLRTAVNRAYYAVLNAARALLVLLGGDARSHDDVMTLLSLKLVKTGRLGADVIKTFKVLLSRRLDVDYGDFDAVDGAEAESSLTKAEEALAALDALRRELAAELPD